MQDKTSSVPAGGAGARGVISDGSGHAGAAEVTTEVRYRSRADGTWQPARFHGPPRGAPAPLLVGLHTWSADYRQHYLPETEAWCAARGWVFIHPNFRGPNWTPAAAGSDLVVADVLDAVAFAQAEAAVDACRIYLLGGSGGGHLALLLAGRCPEVWAGVSAWVPISDLAAWYHECEARGLAYASHLVKSCGGVPGASAAVDAEYRQRSPLTWLAGARGLPLDIQAGIHDGHTGSVPVSQALRAFNAVAAEADGIPETAIRTITERELIPTGLRGEPVDGLLYQRRRPLFRRTSGQVRVTLFEGGHDVVEPVALEWLSQQCRASAAVVPSLASGRVSPGAQG